MTARSARRVLARVRAREPGAPCARRARDGAGSRDRRIFRKFPSVAGKVRQIWLRVGAESAVTPRPHARVRRTLKRPARVDQLRVRDHHRRSMFGRREPDSSDRAAHTGGRLAAQPDPAYDGYDADADVPSVDDLQAAWRRDLGGPATQGPTRTGSGRTSSGGTRGGHETAEVRARRITELNDLVRREARRSRGRSFIAITAGSAMVALSSLAFGAGTAQAFDPDQMFDQGGPTANPKPPASKPPAPKPPPASTGAQATQARESAPRPAPKPAPRPAPKPPPPPVPKPAPPASPRAPWCRGSRPSRSPSRRPPRREPP